MKFKELFAPSDMTTGTPWKKILMFTVPMLIGNVAQQLYSTADSVIVGRFIGDNALAAVGSAGPIYNLLLVLFILRTAFPEKFSGFRHTAVVFDRDLCTLFFGIRDHRTEFDDTERPAVGRDTLLQEKDTAFGIAFNPYSDDQHERQTNNGEYQRHKDVKAPFDN